MITREMVASGYNNGLFDITDSPDDGAVVCYVGDTGFRLYCCADDGVAANEYLKNTPTDDIIDVIFNALDSFQIEDPFGYWITVCEYILWDFVE